MINRKKQILVTIFSGIVLMLAGSISISFAQLPAGPSFPGTRLPAREKDRH